MVKRPPLRRLKHDVLRVLARGPHDAGEVARDANFWPIRAVYPYMRRSERQGLVRGSVRFRKVEYTITGKGRPDCAGLKHTHAISSGGIAISERLVKK